MNDDIAPFRIDVPQADLDDLTLRLSRTRWPDQIPGSGWDYGVPVDYVRRLVDHWQTGYDWRRWEATLNAYPQFMTEIDGQDIYVLHVRSPRPDSLALILTHGWPGSVVEYLNVIGPLSRDFHLVIPSLPGFAFSGPTRERGWNRHRTARAWAELMRRFGYQRYGAIGNDAGSFVSPELGRVDSDRVVGVHVTQIFSFPSGDPAEFASLTPADHEALRALQWFHENKMAFNVLHSQQPQTLSYAICDSPVGLLGWHAQLMGEELDPDFVLTNVMLYWLTGTATSATRFYYEDAKVGAAEAAGPTTVPIGLAMFAGDFVSIRTFAERDHQRIVRWTGYGEGGHYAAYLAPDVLSHDVREFFAALPQS
ncbi:epoxide hydrolase family protein [Micromonospora sp. LOL_014]|uniref:epoxide hydrolase family protein n=1 Tax=Micromonospora sp. LOL_014 TaxID=3345415 RepID=UPI003A868BF0